MGYFGKGIYFRYKFIMGVFHWDDKHERKRGRQTDRQTDKERERERERERVIVCQREKERVRDYMYYMYYETSYWIIITLTNQV